MGFITFSQGAPTTQPTPPTPTAIYAPDCGGTTFSPHATTRAVYVDSTDGNDSYDGLYPDHTYGNNHGPKRTIYTAYRLLRTGFPDWLLLKRGCIWTDATLTNTATTNIWAKSGLDSTNVMLIGWYGSDLDAQPEVNSTTSHQIITNLASGVQYLATTGINITSDYNVAGYDQSFVQQPYWTGATRQTNGWTVFTPTTGTSHDTRIVYCDASAANDNGNGLSPATAKKTIAAARPLLRNGFPDWLLLKRGETWTESLAPGIGGGPLQDWLIGGFSATEPMLIATYGSMALARPKLRTGQTNPAAHGLSIKDRVSGAGSNMAVCGIEFIPYDRLLGITRPHGIHMQGMTDTSNFLLEDCKITNYHVAVIANGDGHYWDYNAHVLRDNGGRITNLMIRRNIMADSWGSISLGTGTGDGMLIWDTNGILVEENVLDHNGWLDENSDTFFADNNYYARNFYCQNLNTGVKIRGNIFAGTDGVQVRPGGNCDNNLCAKLAIGISFGAGNGFNVGNPGGVGGTTRGNVVVHGRNLSNGTHDKRGVGIDSGNTVGWYCTYNIVAHNHLDVDGGSGRGINIGKVDTDNGTGNPMTVGCIDSHIHHNVVYDWQVGYQGGGDGAYVQFEYQNGSPPHLLGSTLTDNDFQLTVRPGGTVGAEMMVLLQTPDLLAGNFVNARNRWYKANDGPGQGLWRESGVGRTLAQWMTDTGDSTSTWALVATGSAAGQYPNPSADLYAYYATIAPVHGVAADGTLAPYLVACRLQQRGNWEPALMPAYSIDDPVPGVGVYYPGVTYNGPLRYFRDGFALSHLGMTLTSVLTASGSLDHATHLGGTPVVITGTGFLDYASTVPSISASTLVRVYFGKVLATSIVVVSDTQITCTTPAGTIGAPLVEIDGGDGIVRSSSLFTYT